jgi:predicted negative regulator of RcsB-dependent stress response
MENLSAFVLGVVVTLGGVAVVVLLWHLWQQHQQPAQQQSAQQQQPQIPQYVHGINASVQGTLQVIQQILQAVQNPTRVRLSSWRVAAFNDHADLSPPSIDVQSGQGATEKNIAPHR